MKLRTRVSLLKRLGDLEDQAGWQEFFQTYRKLICTVAIKSGLTEAEADDVLQETVIAVARKMPGFEYVPERDSFKGWLLQITRWKIADQYRKRPPTVTPRESAEDAARRTAFLDRIPDPAINQLEAIWEKEWKQHLLKLALKQVKRQVTSRQYEIFLAYVIKEIPASEVSRTFGVTIDQVYLTKHRLSESIRQEIKALRVTPFKTDHPSPP